MYDVLGFCASEQLFLWLQVWQHCDCMRLETEVEHYLCELCDPRPIDRVGVTVFEAPSFYTFIYFKSAYHSVIYHCGFFFNCFCRRFP